MDDERRERRTPDEIEREDAPEQHFLGQEREGSLEPDEDSIHPEPDEVR